VCRRDAGRGRHPVLARRHLPGRREEPGAGTLRKALQGHETAGELEGRAAPGEGLHRPGPGTGGPQVLAGLRELRRDLQPQPRARRWALDPARLEGDGQSSGQPTRKASQTAS